MDPEAYERWRSASEAARLRDADFDTLSSEPVEPLYTPADLKDLDYDRDLGYPGAFPYTRGVYPTMYRGRLWTFRQFSGFGNAAETNRRYKFLLERGQTGLSVAFDMPTLMGRDSDDPMAEGEVGRCGVAVDSVADMEVLFNEIPLSEITTSMTISGPAAMVFAMWLVVAERQGVPWSRLEGTLQTDILKEYIAQKEWIYPPQPHLRLTADLMAFCRDKVPKYHPVSISGYHIREAGSTAAQELAFTLASGFAHVELGVRAGMAPDEVASRASFFFNSHIDFFEEIAKFRAARRLWARWMRTRYGCTDEQSLRLRFHTQTAGCSLTAQQPYNNVVRTAYEALAAVLGGTQSLHTNSLDEVLALPTEEAAELALRTQQILAYETGAGNVIDPLGGSYLVEALTDRVEGQAERYFARIDEMGDGSILDGMLQGIEDGYFQAEIADAAYRYQRLVEQGRKVVVGVNRFQRPAREGEINVLQFPPGTERRQIEDLRARRGARDPESVRAALVALVAAAEAPGGALTGSSTGSSAGSSTGAGNLMWPLIACARAGCTLGEMVNALKEPFGTYRESPAF
ncbi:MAG TPA: methylmalonyl-CoA mutase family protein [Actinomycetota bacterium]|nr:methylmalonyl-CoA mutase family protein [Actinomycetota bacterium]